ncbi:hypothetical protein Emtol_0331 (plasmid) [Emticicia oligotrophica DSM 17448]|uniref:DUF4625 domain-containing protein n=1 Tax=Emticicia oligotrophica (strain DSM 17448 / CIP 109782 / MTCC 6937 / GPTSA100-15) TaxID=929562 RepID=A0ABM5N7S0_EMTOG|nr:hypothetical protein [Emticicia oligotrophica]AFK05598.1 hypothetical protein Emtol_0331 [Emticicia oligotrophica DSM 17448]
MKRIIAIITLLLLLQSCISHLDIVPVSKNIESAQATVLPDFNFNVRVASGSDIIKSTESQLYNIYIRQSDFEVSNQVYYLIVQPTNNYDGNIEINDGKTIKSYRGGDWIPIFYDNLLNSSINIKYSPVKPSIGTYTINFTCFDKLKRTKTISRNLTVNP